MQISKNHFLKEQLKQNEIKGKQRLQSVLQAVAFSVVPIAVFYLMEFYEHVPWKEVRPQAQWLNIVLFELLAWGLFFLIGRAGVALQILSGCSMEIGRAHV